MFRRSIDITISNEERDVKGHIIQNVCSILEKSIDKLDNVPVNEAIRRMFMNDCMSAVCLPG